MRADLADLRVFVGGSPAEFMIESDAPQRATETRALVPVDVRERSGGDAARPTVVETWDVLLPSDLASTGVEWRLRFGLTSSELVRELTVHRVDAQGAESPVVSTTLFRMASPLREKVEVVVPPAPGARLRLRLSGAAPALRPTLTLVSASVGSATRELRIPLEVVNTERSGGSETIFTVRRPRGVVPESLVFETSSGAFQRDVLVEDAGTGGLGGSGSGGAGLLVGAIGGGLGGYLFIPRDVHLGTGSFLLSTGLAGALNETFADVGVFHVASSRRWYSETCSATACIFEISAEPCGSDSRSLKIARTTSAS